jgi:hypothetical protein
MGLLDPISSEAERYRRLITGPEIGVTPEEIEEEKRKKRQGLLSVAASRDATEEDGDDFEAPVHPGKDFSSYMAGQGGVSGFFGSVLKPKLSKMIFRDDLKDYRSAAASYETDKALFDIEQAERVKRAENSAGDEQDEALADYYRSIGRPDLALQIEAGGVSAMDLNSKVVGTGQDLVSPVTNDVQFAGRERDDRTTLERNTEFVGNLLGISDDDAALGELAGIVMDPVQTTEAPDGTVRHDNAFAPFLERVRAGQQAAAAQSAGVAPGQSPQTGAGAPGISAAGVSSDGAAAATIRAAVNKDAAEEITGARKEVGVWDKVQANLDRLGERKQNKDGTYTFTPLKGVNEIYGRNGLFGLGGNIFPDALRGEEEGDAAAEIEMLLSTLSVEEREKLAGQGQITEGEQAMLTNSLSALQRKGFGEGNISDAKVAEHLEIVYGVMENARARARAMQERSGAPIMPGDETRRTNFKGVSDEVFDAEIPYLKQGALYTLPDGNEMKWDGERFVKP